MKAEGSSDVAEGSGVRLSSMERPTNVLQPERRMERRIRTPRIIMMLTLFFIIWLSEERKEVYKCCCAVDFIIDSIYYRLN